MPTMKRILQIIAKSQQYLLFHVMYLLGIGIPAGIAKILGKHFLLCTTKNSTWIEHKPSYTHDTMY